MAVIIDTDSISRILRIITSIALVVFLLRAFPEYYGSLKEIKLHSLKEMEKIENLKVQRSWGLDEPPEFGDGPQGEFDHLDLEQKYRRKIAEAHFDNTIFYWQVIGQTIVDFAIPSSIALLAIYDPHILDTLLSEDQQQIGSDVAIERVIGTKTDNP